MADVDDRLQGSGGSARKIGSSGVSGMSATPAHWTNPLRGSSGTAATGELLIGSLLSERKWIVTPIPLKTGVPDGYDEPSSPAHDRGHDDPQYVALDPAILYLRGREVQPPFQLSTGSARHGG